jgi:hypothetical protein
VTSKHVAYAGGRDGDAELGTLADDAEVAPPRVLSGETKDEGDDLSIEGVVSILAVARERPVASDELAMPTQQGRGRDEERCPTFTREQAGERSKHGAIGDGEPGSCHLALQHRELETKNRDLYVLLIRFGSDADETQQLSNEQEYDRRGHGCDCRVFPTALVGVRILWLHPTRRIQLG